MESVSLLVWLFCLALGLGVFALPQPAQSIRALAGLGVGLSAALALHGAEMVAWPLLATVGLWLGGASFCPAGLRYRVAAWQNWFTLLVTCGALWLVSLFILWSVEESMALTSESYLSIVPMPEALGTAFDNYAWVLLLAASCAGCLVTAFGSASHPPASEKDAL